MRNLFYQMVHTLKCVLRDTKPLISKLLTIILIILILGSAFQDAFGKDSLEPVRVGWLNQDEGPMGSLILEQLQQQEDIGAWMTLVEVSSFAEGQRLAGDSDVPRQERIGAMILIPQDFSARLQRPDAGSAAVTIYCGQSSTVESTLVQVVFDTFVNVFNINAVLGQSFGTGLPADFDLDAGLQTMPMDTQKTPDAMSYYAVAMLMMILIFGAHMGCESVAEDYLGVLGERIKTTPLKPHEQYIGKVLGLCIANALEGLVVVAFTGLVYGVNWGSNIPMLLLVVFSMSCAAVSLGVLICMLTQNPSRGDTVCTLLVLACTFLAGGFVKMDMGPLKYLSPNFYGQTAVFNTVYGGDMAVVWIYIGILWSFAAAAVLLAALLSRRKKA